MTIGDEIPESAKAIQEVAKTTNTALEIVKDSGGFFSKVIGEPLSEAVGLFFTDRLKFARKEQRKRISERSKEFIKERKIEELRPIPPKLSLPIIENGILEDNDELQDLWARLLAAAVDPNYDGTMRTAFIDILKQLEVNDVHILNYIYADYVKANKKNIAIYKSSKNPNKKIYNIGGNDAPVWGKIISENLDIVGEHYRESIDNLIRVRCVAPFIRDKEVEVPKDDRRHRPSPFNTFGSFTSSSSEKVKFNVTHTYDRVCITQLGISFAKACMPPKSEETEQA